MYPDNILARLLVNETAAPFAPVSPAAINVPNGCDMSVLRSKNPEIFDFFLFDPIPFHHSQKNRLAIRIEAY